jgi:hypothetical protein
MDQDTSDGEKQVAEVQRVEGIRLALEVLAWAMQDRKSALFFEVCRLPTYSVMLTG